MRPAISNNKTLSTGQSIQTELNSGRLSKKRAPRKRFASFDEAALAMRQHRSLYIAMARKSAIEIASARADRSVTIDDVRELCPPPDDIDPRVMGAIFTEKGVWESMGYVKSTRKTCHHRPIQRFQLLGH
ncbi:MAG: hypothetical protein CTY35_00115 [Methylotenera sp.]|uniref:hypothetical protein n=1 Tax=Methylotenera sp. TaxID=2051956 RepID=UPI000D44A460|nr:hypothetical protein [Methylotenera sp.]PPC84760.1 MAG: hypothetical protein CTY38_00115 [Methylotenera sp.]PPD02119.1 MAG: hypothetical protein CTY35_00115 [Methylotenera sp.]